MLQMSKVGTAAAIVGIVMKNTFLALFAVIATASFTQAADVQTRVAPQYVVTQERIEFMVNRIEAVVHKEIVRSLMNPASNSGTVEARAKTQPGAKFAFAKDANSNVLRSNKNS